MKQAFRLFDKEEKGVVTTQEIGSVLRNLGLFPTEHELKQMLDDIDIDGGKLNFRICLKEQSYYKLKIKFRRNIFFRRVCTINVQHGEFS